MTEIAMRTEQGAVQAYQQSSIDRLERWAQQAIVVRQMAEGIVNTTFCPKAYRGKPDEATAAILAGAELNLDPMASLRAFDDIQGTPAPKAITLRAVVQAAGHDIVVLEESATKAVVTGRRRGAERWQTSEWTIERAQAAGYVTKNPNYKTKPSEMLVARATAQVCRWIGSDAIMGMPYSAEEISDQIGIDAQPATRRVTAADIVGMTTEYAGPPALATERVPATVEAIDVTESLSRIRHAATQDDLDRIKEMCRAAGLTSQNIKDAWSRRSAELAAPVVEPNEILPGSIA